MEIAKLLLNQTAIMFLLLIAGYVLFKVKLIDSQGTKGLGNLLLYLAAPSMIIKAYVTEKTPENTHNMLFSFIFGIVALLISMIISGIIFRRKHAVANFGCSFSNASFSGASLVSAVLGSSAVTYCTGMSACLIFLQWTYGQAILSGRLESVKIKKILLNPIFISLSIGLLIYFLQINVHVVIKGTINNLASLNLPLAMIVVGSYLARINLLDMLKDKKAYFVSFIRLLVIPLVTIAVFKLIPNYQLVKTAVLICAAAPVGSNVVIFSQRNDIDGKEGTIQVCLSSVLAIITMPIMLLLM